MQYNEEFETRDDVFKYQLKGVTFYFVPNGDGKYEFCTKEETKEDFQVALWMTRVKNKEVSLDSTPFVVRDALLKAVKKDISKRDLIEFRKEANRFADTNGVEFKEKPISNKIYPSLSRSIKVLGLAEEYYVEDWVDCNGHSRKSDNVKYKFVVQDVNNKNTYMIELKSLNGSCGSGYCNATVGCLTIDKFDGKKIPFTHMPKSTMYIEGFAIDPVTLEYSQEETAKSANEKMWFHPVGDFVYNNVFYYNSLGSDSYYPSGSVGIEKDKFNKLERAMDKRPVWIIKGPSGSGKSSLARHLEGLSVFETDSVDKLPEVIYDDVVVLGNRSGFSVEDVKGRLFGEHEAIVVSFDKDDRTNERNKCQQPINRDIER